MLPHSKQDGVCVKAAVLCDGDAEEKYHLSK